jgi:hypothetical protein
MRTSARYCAGERSSTRERYPGKTKTWLTWLFF